MAEDTKENKVINNDADVSEEAEKAEKTAAEETAGSVSDDIEYTLLIHEVPDLTIPLPAAQPEDEEEDAEDIEGEEEAADAEGSAAPASDDDIEYTLLIHEVSDLTIPLPAVQPEDGAAEETTEVEEGAEETQESAEEAEGSADTEETSYGLPEGEGRSSDMGELTKRIEARRRYNERKKRRFRTRFYIIMTILVLVIAFLLLSLSSIFTVDSIEVRGNQHYTAEEIINMGHAVPGRNLIYDLNKKEIEDYLEQNPYIKNATVSRKIPSTMVIRVTERAEKMAFRYDDDYLIMDEDGILLKKTRNEPMATLVEGIVINKIKLGEKIGAVETERLDRAIDLIHSMTSADMYFVRVDMSKDNVIKAYIYDTLAVKASYDLLIENLENGRLHLVVEKLFSDGIERGTITFDEDGTASFMPAI